MTEENIKVLGKQKFGARILVNTPTDGFQQAGLAIIDYH
jgi:hypothetical protein